MNIEITTRHTELPDEIRDYIHDRGQRLAKYFDDIERAVFVISEEHSQHQVEIIVHAPRNHDLTAKHEHPDAQAAVDGCLDKIERQLRRLKEKLRDHHRQDKAELMGEGVSAEAEGDAGETSYEDIVGS